MKPPMAPDSPIGSRHGATSLSVLVPVYNERFLVAASLERLKVLASSEDLERLEIIIVDDASTDETAEVLAQFERGLSRDPKVTWRFLRHDRNGGEGPAGPPPPPHAPRHVTLHHSAPP